MKILRVAQKVYPDVTGGGPYHVHALSRDQAAMGHDVTVLTIQRDPNLPHIEERNGYTVIRYPPTVEILGNDISASMAQHLKSRGSFDVIHAHSHLYFSTNLAVLKGQLAGIPVAITNHGLYSQSAPKEVFKWYLKTIGRWTFNRADLVFCYTDEDRRRLRSFGVETDVAVVPNGIDRNRFTPEGPTSNQFEDNGPTVLFVGRLTQGKRPQHAVEAVEQLRETHPDASLFICGDGPLRENVVDDGRSALGDAMTVLGEVPYEEMPPIYREADALVLPSRAEGVPRTVLEALASGTPVVTSDLPQIRSIVDGCGVAVPPGDVKGFADGLAEVIGTQTDPLAANSGINDDEAFDWELTVDRTTQQLAHLAGESHHER